MTAPTRDTPPDAPAVVVTIDGPAGAGKSSVARALALRLGFRFLDTGAMYRAVAVAAQRAHVDCEDPQALAQLARNLQIDIEPRRVLLDGQDVTERIRDPDITALTRHVADNPGVRDCLVALQRRLAAHGQIVTEGRDQGTVAFPDAPCKIFLTASPEERARRRAAELRARGETACVDEVLAQQNQRDHRDRTRAVGPLVPAPDATVVLTDGLELPQVVDRIEAIVRQRCRLQPRDAPEASPGGTAAGP